MKIKFRKALGNTRPRMVNCGNVVQRLRRMRFELGIMMNQIDSALERIEEENQSFVENRRIERP